MADNKILDLLESTTKKENLTDYKVEVHGKTGKGDGYLGKITFITVTGKTKSGDKKKLDYVVKTSTQNPLLRKQINIKSYFEREMYIYNQIVPTFKKVEEETGFQSKLHSLLPKCYGSKIYEDYEILILNNLRSEGFYVWDRTIPMTFDHAKLVLEAFGQWHSFSFAFKQKHPKAFAHMTDKVAAVFPDYIIDVKLFGVINRWFETIRKFYEDDPEISKVKFTEDDIRHICGRLVREDPDNHVIIHGDSWTNNFMFKNEEKGEKPIAACIIDWQLAGLASPILDLSAFIYSCVDTGKYDDVKDLLRIYYDSLTEHLQGLGCDPLDVFTFDKLMEHWRRFSSYGLLLATFLLKFCLSQGDEPPDFGETAEQGKDFLENFTFDIADKELYYERVKNNVLHYIKWKN